MKYISIIIIIYMLSSPIFVYAQTPWSEELESTTATSIDSLVQLKQKKDKEKNQQKVDEMTKEDIPVDVMLGANVADAVSGSPAR